MDPFSNYYSQKPSFMLKIVKNHFLCEHGMAMVVEVFDSAVVEKNICFDNFQRSEFICFWSVNR